MYLVSEFNPSRLFNSKHLTKITQKNEWNKSKN